MFTNYLSFLFAFIYSTFIVSCYLCLHLVVGVQAKGRWFKLLNAEEKERTHVPTQSKKLSRHFSVFAE